MGDGFEFSQKHIHLSNYECNPDFSRYTLDLASIVGKPQKEEEVKKEEKEEEEVKMPAAGSFLIHEVESPKEQVKRDPLIRDNTAFSYYKTIIFLNIEYNYGDEETE